MYFPNSRNEFLFAVFIYSSLIDNSQLNILKVHVPRDLLGSLQKGISFSRFRRALRQYLYLIAKGLIKDFSSYNW